MQQLLTDLWRQTPGLNRLAGLIAAAGGEARIVGGAVRDVLIGRLAGDIDLACTLRPEQLIAALQPAGIKTVPTGIDHGTVTAVIDHKPFEITTLRRDVTTDGRRAEVAFTYDWQADAARRDFTFNALYLAADGKLYDYFDGQSDLAAGRVRFIGQAANRINEDVLRILRFYRFHAWFGNSDPDAAALTACREFAHLLPKLSSERVWNEIAKTLMAPSPAAAWTLMRDNAALKEVLPEATNIERLSVLIAIEREHIIAPDYLRRLVSLLPKQSPTDLAATLAKRLRLSAKESATLTALLAITPQLVTTDALALRRLIYAYGPEAMKNALLLAATGHRNLDVGAALKQITAWNHPVFPLRGEDIVALGVASGPKVGTILRAVESWWQDRDMRPSRDDCLKEAKQQLSN